MNTSKVNKELLSNEATHYWRGERVKVFYSTYNKYTDLITAEYLSGKHKGKWTNFNLEMAQIILKGDR